MPQIDRASKDTKHRVARRIAAYAGEEGRAPTANASGPILVDFNGRAAIVTGASRGIGRAVATMLAERGAKLVVVGQDAVRLEEAAHAMDRSAGVVPVAGDVGRRVTADAAVQAALARFGRLDILANIAGAFPTALLGDTDDEQFAQSIATNLAGTFICVAKRSHRCAIGTVLRSSMVLHGRTVSNAGAIGLQREQSRRRSVHPRDCYRSGAARPGQRRRGRTDADQHGTRFDGDRPCRRGGGGCWQPTLGSLGRSDRDRRGRSVSGIAPVELHYRANGSCQLWWAHGAMTMPTKRDYS